MDFSNCKEYTPEKMKQVMEACKSAFEKEFPECSKQIQEKFGKDFWKRCDCSGMMQSCCPSGSKACC